MGFFKKTTSSYPARRNRINQQSHPATVIPPSNYGAQNPTPIAASVYQANGTPVPTVAATTATTAPGPQGRNGRENTIDVGFAG